MPEEFKHIIRMAGKDLRGERQVQMALYDLKGVSFAIARAVAYAAGVDPFEKLGNLSGDQIKEMEKVLKNPAGSGIPIWMMNRRKDYELGTDMHGIGAAVDISLRGDVGRERRIGSRRGKRHDLGLPVRGQHTRTTGRKGLVVGVKRKDIRIREEAAKAEKGKKEEGPKPEKEKAAKAPKDEKKKSAEAPKAEKEKPTEKKEKQAEKKQ